MVPSTQWASAIAYEIAAKAAYRQSMPKGRPEILEPIMKLDVFCGEENMGDVIGDLNRRRGMIKSQEPANTGIRIKADAPLSEMFGYIGSLRTMTSGVVVSSQWSSPTMLPVQKMWQTKSSKKLKPAKRLVASSSNEPLPFHQNPAVFTVGFFCVRKKTKTSTLVSGNKKAGPYPARLLF